MQTDFEKLVPQGVLFSLKELSEYNIIKPDMAKKLIQRGVLEVTKVGAKNFVSRTEAIRYLTDNTIPKSA